MDFVTDLLMSYLLLTTFMVVLADQGGLPIPGYPFLVAAAARVSSENDSLLALLLVATAANVVADLVWFASGRKYGPRVLGLLCRVSLTPQSCVANTRKFNSSWGSAALVLTKFLPGVSTIAMVLAGDSKITVRRFLALDSVGAIAWAGSAIALGALFPTQINDVLQAAGNLSKPLLPIVVAGFLGYIAFKLYSRSTTDAAVQE